MHSDWIIFTDLDGTLLDHATYSWNAAGEALDFLRRQQIPLVIVTSKTRAEVMPILRDLRRREPFVAENGGAIYLPAAYFPFKIEKARRTEGDWRRVSLGTQRRALLRALARAARRAGVRVRGFAKMTAREVGTLTGLNLHAARRAMQREYDEPFQILDPAPQAWPRLLREIRREGLNATRGSRFFHILGRNDKGAAVRRLLGWYRRARGGRVRAVGLGDSPNDIPLLRAVHIAFLVARPGARYDAETRSALPRARLAGGIGPAGWDRAVRTLLRV